ncbi:hypothetical protein HPB51_009521 [Rhipicephalus microplus]|uniref:Uncharacterized protein n=1 Tax=Rhipicephalus microplus TaxID=6941 RepID=A0A9J6F0W6_RHIMP|nr:hypothetical protein HPB51_009521 [Rhipicephalus microplus]
MLWRIQRDLPLDLVPWPFRCCTLADIKKAAGGAQLPTNAAVEFCATCRVTVHHQCHYKGIMHVAWTMQLLSRRPPRGRLQNQPRSASARTLTWRPFADSKWGGPPFPGTAFRAAANRNQRRATDERRRHHGRGPSLRTVGPPAAPSGSQQAGEPSAVTDASTAPGAGATRITVTQPASPGTPARWAESATATQAAPDAVTPATPVLRRSARHRRPPDRYSTN